MKKLLALMTIAPLITTSCIHRPDSNLYLQRFDGEVEGVVYNNDDITLATQRSRADVKVVDGVFEHVKIERDQLIGRTWYTIASWNPELDNFGEPQLKEDPEASHVTQITPDEFNVLGSSYVESGNSGNSFVYGSESIFSFQGASDDYYFYMIGKYALEVVGTNLYISIAGSETSRQTYEDIIDLSNYTLADGSIDPQYTIGEVFDWTVNQAQYSYGYHGDIQTSPFNEIDGSITSRGTFRDVEENTSLQQFLRMIEFDHTEDGIMYGRHSNNGWVGNYGNINDFFVGKEVDSISSLWDRVNIGTSIPGETPIIDIDNGIAGSTVSMSRENGAFQDALVKLGKDIEKDGILWG